MATKQRSRSRRSNPSRDRGPRYVAPVLDPNWQNPYSPSSDERLHNQRVVRRFAVRRRLPLAVGVVVVVVVLIVLGFVVTPWLLGAAVVYLLAFAFLGRRDLVRYIERDRTLGAS